MEADTAPKKLGLEAQSEQLGVNEEASDYGEELSPAGINNQAMVTVFGELFRKSNQENNEEAAETYAVWKADMLLKGEGESVHHIVGGAGWSILSHDAFPANIGEGLLAGIIGGKWQ